MKELIEKCVDILGMNIEYNMFCVSAYYRAVSEEFRFRVEVVVDEICVLEECLIKYDGKMVWEVWLCVVWDKGKVLLYL